MPKTTSLFLMYFWRTFVEISSVFEYNNSTHRKIRKRGFIMKRKAFFITLILCLATVSAFAWAILKYYGSLNMTATPEVEQGVVYLNGDAELDIGDVTLPIVSSADGVNFFNEAGDKVSVGSTTYEITGATCDNLKVTLSLPEDDPLSDSLRVYVDYDGGGDVISTTKKTASFKNLQSGKNIKITAWYEGTVCTSDDIYSTEGTPIKLNLLAY